MKKRILSLFTAILMVCSVFCVMPNVDVNAASFTPRLAQPTTDNPKYYADNPYYKAGLGIPNCTCYAWGRAWEILGVKPDISTVGNAGTWWWTNQSRGVYSYGSTPKLGAIACWDQYDKNKGHVAVVEKIEGNKVTISESHYGSNHNGTPFDTKTMNADSSDYLTKYRFLGYIYIGDFENSFFDFWGVDEGATINNTYKLWFKQEGYGSGSSCDVNIHIDGKDAQSAVGTIYQDNSGLFSFELDTTKYTNGEHTIYAVIRNNSGEEKWVSRKVLILNTRMAIDNISGGKGTINIKGWAFVDNSPVICDVEVYIGNERIATFKADNESTDVGNHRFDEVIKTSYTGNQTVTVKAINPETKAFISMQRTVTITSTAQTTTTKVTTTKPTTTTTKKTTTTTKPTTTKPTTTTTKPTTTKPTTTTTKATTTTTKPTTTTTKPTTTTTRPTTTTTKPTTTTTKPTTTTTSTTTTTTTTTSMITTTTTTITTTAPVITTRPDDVINDGDTAIIISDVNAESGETVDVSIDLSNNPGIASLGFELSYDPECLEFVDSVNGTVMGESSFECVNSKNNVIMVQWLNFENDITESGTILVLKFKVLDDITAESTKIGISYNDDDIKNLDDKVVPVKIKSGNITIGSENSIAGDANGDSAVNLKDVIIIRQFVAKWDVDVDTEAADVNNDGVVDLKDVILIRRFIAGGWDVELI